MDSLKNLADQVFGEVKTARNIKELDKVYKKYLSKKGKLAEIFVVLKKMPLEEKKALGQKTNLLKKEISRLIAEKSQALEREAGRTELKNEKLDISRPGFVFEMGSLHPLTLIQEQAQNIFQAMGFAVIEGPEVETEKYNFDVLNIPSNHPARDMWDTFWLKPEKDKLLLRTHTSPVQVRYMENHQPPLKIIAPGRVFRREATDASHEIQFYQIEGLMVDESISAANFKAIISQFLEEFFKTKLELRLRPSFFPFTEPSFEIDVKRKGGGWLELMGAGMVHPYVFKAAGLNPKNWQGFAFGVGVDRLAMIKYKINDIRLFYQNDLRFLKQF